MNKTINKENNFWKKVAVLRVGLPACAQGNGCHLQFSARWHRLDAVEPSSLLEGCGILVWPGPVLCAGVSKWGKHGLCPGMGCFMASFVVSVCFPLKLASRICTLWVLLPPQTVAFLGPLPSWTPVAWSSLIPLLVATQNPPPLEKLGFALNFPPKSPSFQHQSSLCFGKCVPTSASCHHMLPHVGVCCINLLSIHHLDRTETIIGIY